MELWNYFIRDVGAEAFPDASRWKILDRAASAEGRMEAILIHLASKYRSNTSVARQIGEFRQLFQMLRQAIRDNEPLRFDSADEENYMKFKKLSPVMAYLIRGGKSISKIEFDSYSRAWVEVTDNKFENKIKNNK